MFTIVNERTSNWIDDHVFSGFSYNQIIKSLPVLVIYWFISNGISNSYWKKVITGVSVCSLCVRFTKWGDCIVLAFTVVSVNSRFVVNPRSLQEGTLTWVQWYAPKHPISIFALYLYLTDKGPPISKRKSWSVIHD